MSKKSIILHWYYLKKDTVGEINFCVTKFINEPTLKRGIF